MGMKPSEVQAAIAVGGTSLSFNDSTSAEGTEDVPAGGPDASVVIPIPAGVNQMYRLRLYGQMYTEGASNSEASIYEQIYARSSLGALGQHADIQQQQTGSWGGSISWDSDNVIWTLANDGGNARRYRWRWVLSPADPVPFDVSVVM